MANNVLNWAFRQQLPPTQKLVALALANRARKEGTAWPSLATIMRETGLSRRAVIAALKALESSGHIQAIAYPKGGHGKSTVWRLCLENGAGDAPLNSAGSAPLEAENGAVDAPMNGVSHSKNGAPHARNGAAGAPQPLEPLEPLEPRSASRKRRDCTDDGCNGYGRLCNRCAQYGQKSA